LHLGFQTHRGMGGTRRWQAREDDAAIFEQRGQARRRNAVSALLPLKNTCAMSGYFAKKAGKSLAASSVIDASERTRKNKDT
jgi:hypothetical protein